MSQSRLVSLIGPGGVGKSRLALRIAAHLGRNFHDGAWLVGLAPVSNPSLVPEAVAGALRVPDLSDRDPTEALSKYLSERELVVVLDNCERLRRACAELLAQMLPHAPDVRVLATSQEVLGLPGEAVYRLAPLALPQEGQAAEMAELSPAVALFADRAASAMNGFSVTQDNVDTVTELCRRLDGMPLAIELAAAHARFLSPAQILDRMDDWFRLLTNRASGVPGRQQSLKAAVEWSYELCSKPERLVWNRLATFPATFDLTAAEAVCAGDGLSDADVAETVEKLVNRSVLISESTSWGMRYRLLETIREYGLYMLRESAQYENTVPNDVLRSRHLDWCVALAGDFESEWFGREQHKWLERLHEELPSIRAALSFAADHPGRTEAGLRLAASLCFFWRVSAFREGQSWLTRLLQESNAPSTGRTRALLALAWLLSGVDRAETSSVVDEALTIAQRVDPDSVPRALLLKGHYLSSEDPLRSGEIFDASLARARHTGSVADEAFALFGLGWSLGLQGDTAESEVHFRNSLAVCEAIGDRWWSGVVHRRHALVSWIHGDLDTMATAAREALGSSRLVPDLLTCADAICLTGVAEVGRDNHHAAFLFGAAGRYWEDAGGSVLTTPPWEKLLQRAKGSCREALGSATFEEQYLRGREHPMDDAIASALGEQPQPEEKHHISKQAIGLTRRESEVLELISQGLSNKEIASALVISTRTAEAHVQNILTKTGFTARSQVAAWHSRHSHGSSRPG
jgi:predicted ATPase/DNA-binding CsgD family transcriptional regulator